MSTSRSRSILLTGASSGLGAALAAELGRRGHRVALVARREERLRDVAASVMDSGGEAVVLPADLSQTDELPLIVERAVDRLGRLDAVIHNAGLGLPDYFMHCDAEAIRHQLAVNLEAPILLTRHALPHLARAGGLVMNIGSGIGQVANPILGVYGTTKAALAHWNDALRREVRHLGVRVCLVELGPVDTGFFEAVRRLPGGDEALGVGPPTDGLYNALRDRPPSFMTLKAADVARRVADLLERPRRHAAIPRRVIWPMRFAGLVFRLSPSLGDLALSAMVRRVERERGRLVPLPEPAGTTGSR